MRWRATASSSGNRSATVTRPGVGGRGAPNSPAERETYANGVRKAAYRDLDGNEFGFGGAPVS
jgi:hypothetical protein